jgi:hypothetical protein
MLLEMPQIIVHTVYNAIVVIYIHLYVLVKYDIYILYFITLTYLRPTRSLRGAQKSGYIIINTDLRYKKEYTYRNTIHQ